VWRGREEATRGSGAGRAISESRKPNVCRDEMDNVVITCWQVAINAKYLNVRLKSASGTAEGLLRIKCEAKSKAY